MHSDASSRLDAACRAVARQLVPPTAFVQTTGAPKRRDSARNGAVETRNDKTNPIPQPPRRRWTLQPRQMTTIELLLHGSSVAAAARQLGIGRRTIFTWLSNPTFRAELDRRAAARRMPQNGAIRREMAR